MRRVVNSEDINPYLPPEANSSETFDIERHSMPTPQFIGMACGLKEFALCFAIAAGFFTGGIFPTGMKLYASVGLLLTLELVRRGMLRFGPADPAAVRTFDLTMFQMLYVLASFVGGLVYVTWYFEG